MGEGDRGGTRAGGTERSFWVLRPGAPWHDAISLSVYHTCHPALPILATQRAADSLAAKTGRRFTRPREVDLSASHRRQLSGAKKGAVVSALPNAARQQNHAIADGHGFPLAVHVPALRRMINKTRRTHARPALPCQTRRNV